MGQKGHIMVQKGLKMHEKRQKIEFLDLKNLLFCGIFLSGIYRRSLRKKYPDFDSIEFCQELGFGRIGTTK